MRSVKEILQKSKDKKMNIKDYCFEWFTNHGYLYNEVIGWEREEVFKKFNLSPNMKAIPSCLIEAIDHKITKIPKKDSYGQKTGDFELITDEIKTGKMIRVPAPNYMAYNKWKGDKDKQAMAEGFNTPQLTDESQA